MTGSPKAVRMGQQMIEAFPWDTARRCLIRDREGAFGADFTRRPESMGSGTFSDAPRIGKGLPALETRRAAAPRGNPSGANSRQAPSSLPPVRCLTVNLRGAQDTWVPMDSSAVPRGWTPALPRPSPQPADDLPSTGCSRSDYTAGCAGPRVERGLWKPHLPRELGLLRPGVRLRVVGEELLREDEVG